MYCQNVPDHTMAEVLDSSNWFKYSFMRSSCGHHAVTMRSSCGYHAVTMWSPGSHHAVIMWSSCSHHAVTMRSSCSHHAVIMRSSCGHHAVIMRSSCGLHVTTFYFFVFYFHIHINALLHDPSDEFNSQIIEPCCKYELKYINFTVLQWSEFRIRIR